MTSDYGDLELAVLAGVTNDRYLFSKAVEEGFRAELVHSPAAHAVASALIATGRQSSVAIDLLVLKGKLQENGLLTPQVAQCIETLGTMPVPKLDQLLSYLEILKDRETRSRLLKLADRMARYARGEEEPEVPVTDFTAEAFQDLLEIQRERARKRVTPIGTMVEQNISEAKARPEGEQALLGYAVAPFDRLTSSGKPLASKIDILDLNIDKNRDAPDEGVQAIQYAFFVHENRFVELDYKREEEQRADFRGFARIQQIYQTLTEQGGTLRAEAK